MNSSPISSWDQASTCFTFADSEIGIYLMLGMAGMSFLSFMIAIIRHERDAFSKHDD